ncbi:F-box protein [Trifolium medium]|uniref:F-box protein n=1 Tax=Trifolium medium TaxID=97028 RepID=A0A392PXG9_9FABA|nr:F-box protein [Trifolium medium]
MHFVECEREKFEIGNNNHVKLEPIFKLPLRDAKSFREKRDAINNKSKRPLRAARLVSEKNNENNNKGKQRLNIACNPDHDRFEVVNSCNGFLCLCHPYNYIPLVICNPVTGEFIRLPEATTTPLNTARTC